MLTEILREHFWACWWLAALVLVGIGGGVYDIAMAIIRKRR